MHACVVCVRGWVDVGRGEGDASERACVDECVAGVVVPKLIEAADVDTRV